MKDMQKRGLKSLLNEKQNWFNEKKKLKIKKKLFFCVWKSEDKKSNFFFAFYIFWGMMNMMMLSDNVCIKIERELSHHIWISNIGTVILQEYQDIGF